MIFNGNVNKQWLQTVSRISRGGAKEGNLVTH